MRKIKFRAWDTKQNKMYSPEEMGQDELTINPDGRGFVNVSGTDQRLSQYMHHITPMQFTGLLDKQGKEIYEGDIFISPYHKNNFEIIFEDGSFWIVTQNEHLGVGFLTKVQILMFQLEVIGNIYENPELLTEKKED